MQISICINADINRYQTILYDAPITKNEGGRVWLSVKYDDCYWDYELVDDYIDGEDQLGKFAHPIQTLGFTEGFWEGYRILNAEDCIADHLGFV